MTRTFRRSLIAGALLGLLGRPAPAVEPAPEGPAIGQIVVHMLEEGHYNHHPITKEDSKQFLRNYLENYDYGHMFFTKADVEEFEARYGSSLADQVRDGELSAAYRIYDRFCARLKERYALLHEWTASTFTFTADESIPSDWKNAPWPSTEAEVRDIWRRDVKAETLHARLEGQKTSEQIKTVNTRYDNMLENYKQFEASDVLQRFLDALCRVFDPHTDYLAASREEDFKILMRLGLVGIGAVLRSESGYTTVVSLVPGGPADVDKRLKPNDKIEAVAQGDEPFMDVIGMKIDRVVAMLRGTKGTVVRIRVIPADAIDPTTRVVVRLVRDQIHLKEQEAKARVVTLRPSSALSRRIGVIRLPSFYADMQSDGTGKSTVQDVEILLGSLQKKGIEGLVLDLRGNGGGALNEAVSLTGLFIGAGPVLQVKDSSGNISLLTSKRTRAAYTGPLLVLTSRGSASASEILAAALQDYGRAVIVGNKSTFGKGTVQSVISLDSFMPFGLRSTKPGAVHLTIQKFYRVSGGSTQSRGVIPDISLPSIEDHMDISESSLPNSLPYDEIPPTAFASPFRLAPLLPSLKKASAARVASSPEFAYVREDIETHLRRTKSKLISLNEKKRLAEKKETEEIETRRKKDRLARAVPKEEEIEITLDAPDGVPAAAAPKPSSATAEGKESDYEKAPPAPDNALVESLAVLSDMIFAQQTPVADHGPARIPLAGQ